MNTTKKLRLGPLPKTESVKLTFACPASLKADLDRYAALYAQTYGEAVNLVVDDGARRLPEIQDILKNSNIDYRNIRIAPARMEEAFISLIRKMESER